MSRIKLRVAVASKYGPAIDEHFGHAKTFWIYECSETMCRFVEKRDVEHYCLGGHSNQTAMNNIIKTIQDCHAVFVAKIGEGPVDKLKAVGVTANSDYAYDAVEASLTDYIKNSVCMDATV
jgi:predicted Fe-Mo cluster-binding NifX family protein